jgi:hypothetical protein
MSSLAKLPELFGFFSYSREDDQTFNGKLSALRQAIDMEVGAGLGRSKKDFGLWHDQTGIALGKQWELAHGEAPPPRWLRAEFDVTSRRYGPTPHGFSFYLARVLDASKDPTAREQYFRAAALGRMGRGGPGHPIPRLNLHRYSLTTQRGPWRARAVLGSEKRSRKREALSGSILTVRKNGGSMPRDSHVDRTRASHSRFPL